MHKYVSDLLPDMHMASYLDYYEDVNDKDWIFALIF